VDLKYVCLQGVNGTMQFPKGFIKGAVEQVRARGGVAILDEVQTGFGRTGEHFWGFQGHDVIPDMVVMAKGCKDEIFYCFIDQFYYF